MAVVTAILSCNIVNNACFLRQQHPVMSLNKATSLFGLKSNGGGATMMASYRVILITPTGTKELQCPANEYILEVAEESGMDWPFLCRAGACSSCIGKVKSDSVDQTDQSFLDEDQLSGCWVLTCVYSHK